MNIVSTNFMPSFTIGRDEVTDPARGDHERESRDEEKDELRTNTDPTTNSRHNSNKSNNMHQQEQVSVFSTLTELLFNPFLDGYCKTPFCADSDYMPLSCPSRNFYTRPSVEMNGTSAVVVPHTPQRSGPACGGETDEYGDICQSASGASGNSTQRRQRRRPLALAVGYGDELKDQEGRRVVITPRASRTYQQNNAAVCTCRSRVPKSPNIGSSNSNYDRETSPHQSKVVMCKFCTTRRLREEGLLPCRSGDSLGR